jgi:dTDP-4-amino-4,6-dideoxygalactose transaminase
MAKKMLLIRPHLPPLEEIQPYLERIWATRQLTNNGPIHEEFEEAICNYLGVKHICLFANGTLALLFALKALDIKGEVITTPFTSVATIQAIFWNNLIPVFVDINKDDFNINITHIEAAITPETKAVLPVHVFGNPCNVQGINEIAQRKKIKVIYDAAHCFGVKINDNSVCNYGDFSVLSFHATKVFNTFEGGAIICQDLATKKFIDNLKSVGYSSDRNFLNYGFNAKMNEFQSSIGIAQLKYVENVIERRKEATKRYTDGLSDMKGIKMQVLHNRFEYNYAYLPILINSDEFGASRDEVINYLEQKKIYARRYFYPLISDFPEFREYKRMDLPIAEEVANQVLCLPLYHDITEEEINYIVESLKKIYRKTWH